MLSPQLLHHLEAFDEENDRTGTSAENDDEEGRRGRPLAPPQGLSTLILTKRSQRLHNALLERSDRLLCSLRTPCFQAAAVLLSGVSLATIGLGILWNLSVAAFLIWNLMESRREATASVGPTTDPRDARIAECRRMLSTMLASIGAPPLSSMLSMAEDFPDRSSSSKRQPSLDRTANEQQGDPSTPRPTDCDLEDVDRILHVLERFTRPNVALIGRVDELVEWIRDATAMRFLGTAGVASTCRPSVERVERSAASRLVRQRTARQNGDDSSNPSTAQHHHPAPNHSLGSLPLSSLRRNVAIVGLQNLQALCLCLPEGDTELDDNALEAVFFHRTLDLPDVVTLSWIRSLRSDLVHVVSLVVEETMSHLVDCRSTGQAADGLDGTIRARRARPSDTELLRAARAAEEGLSYLRAYPHACHIPSRGEASTKAEGGSETGAELSRRLGGLQSQCDALTTALLTLQETIDSDPHSLVHQDDEPRRWWTVVRDLSSQISDEVEALDTDLKLSGGRGGQDAASTSESPPYDDPQDRTESSNRSCENDYVLVDSSCGSDDDEEADGRKNCDGDVFERNRTESRTLVYSGQGCVVRSRKPSLPLTSRRTNDASTEHRHALPDPSALYQSLYEELRGRLGMIRLDEVEASASPQSSPAVTIADEEESESRTLPAEDLGAPQCGAARERVSAAFLAELRGALRVDAAIAEAGTAWGE